VLTPKLLVNLSRPNNVLLETVILNTRAKANVISYILIRSLGYPILNTDKLKLKTMLGQTV